MGGIRDAFTAKVVLFYCAVEVISMMACRMEFVGRQPGKVYRYGNQLITHGWSDGPKTRGVFQTFEFLSYSPFEPHKTSLQKQ